ncbi:Transcriptional regulator [Fulvia fulva]|nr:Transcriptional regulator [Fulvia fulva]
MKFGHAYETALANEGFPEEWVENAIEYKHLKKCIKKVHRELESLGLDHHTLHAMSELVAQPKTPKPSTLKDYFSAANPSLTAIQEEFTPQLRILVDSNGTPLDARLAPETKASLEKLAKHEIVVSGRQKHRDDRHGRRPSMTERQLSVASDEVSPERKHPLMPDTPDTRWIQVPLSSAQDFFDMLEPKLGGLESLRDSETHALEDKILDLGDAVENVVAPVKEGFEAHREISYRDLYFWREMFRLYIENPIFYKETEQSRGAITFNEARNNLQEYDQKLRETGLLAKMKTPQAKIAAQRFLDLNLEILKAMHFQEMNAQAMKKILKKFDKRTGLEGKPFVKTLQVKYPEMLTNGKNVAGGFANSIARDMQAEMGTKVLAIVPQLDDWVCPVCYGMAWRPVNLGCCKSVFCIRCIIELQGKNMKKCPMCNTESVMAASGKNIDFETMDFLGIFFPMEVKKRQKENERAQMLRDYGEDFVKPGCTVM